MRNGLVVLFMLALLMSFGCNSHGTPGGPGATAANTQTVGQAEATFSLDVPNLSTKIKQGESKIVTIGIKRGKNFNEDVHLSLTGLPQGITLDPASPVIQHNDKDAAITMKAAEDAALGDFTVKVVGHPTKGADATNEFKVTIDTK